MKKTISLIMAVVATAIAWAQPSKLFTDSIDSSILGVKRAYTVYLPAGYDAAKHYPVLYLLHGKGGANEDWQRTGRMKDVADRLIKAGEAKPMVVIMPDAGETNTPGLFGYFDFPGWNYEQFFFDELMPQVEAKYNAGGNKQQRAIAGLSMGGGGATAYAQKHPDLFAADYAMSALMSLPEGRVVKDALDHYNQCVLDNSCVEFVKNASPEQIDKLRSVKWYVDCGDDDFLFDTNIDFYQAMRKAKVPVELRVRDGGHDWEYWHTALYTCLPFVSAAFGIAD